MKTLASAIGLISVFGLQAPLAFGSSLCAVAAGNAALAVAQPARPGSTVVASVRDAKLLKASGSTLYYKIEIAFDIQDGYSDSFPPEHYTVVATGTEQACRVTGVRLNKK